MNLFELVAEVWSRGGELRTVDGRIRYGGPPLAPDDPIRTTVVEHRDALLTLADEHERRREKQDSIIGQLWALPPDDSSPPPSDELWHALGVAKLALEIIRQRLHGVVDGEPVDAHDAALAWAELGYAQETIGRLFDRDAAAVRQGGGGS